LPGAAPGSAGPAPEQSAEITDPVYLLSGAETKRHLNSLRIRRLIAVIAYTAAYLIAAYLCIVAVVSIVEKGNVADGPGPIIAKMGAASVNMADGIGEAAARAVFSPFGSEEITDIFPRPVFDVVDIGLDVPPLDEWRLGYSSFIHDVMSGALPGFPEVAIGEAFGGFFGNTSWEHIESPDGDDLVVFTGEMLYNREHAIAKIHFNHSGGAAQTVGKGNEFGIESIYIDGEPRDAFTAQHVLYSVVGALPTHLFGNWRSGDEALELYSDGTGLARTDSRTEAIAWMEYNGCLCINTPSGNVGLDYKRVGFNQLVLSEESGAEAVFFRYRPMGTSQLEPPQGEEGWVSLSGRRFSVSVPPLWNGYELFNEPFTALSHMAEIFGEGAGGSYRMDIRAPESGIPDEVIYDYPIREPFLFNDGQTGYMLEDRNEVTWLCIESSISISLIHNGNRSVFTENEELFMHIARSLHRIF